MKTFQNLDQPVECSFAGCPLSRHRPNVLIFCANESGRRLDLFTSILLFWQYIFLMVFLVKHWMSLLKWCFLQYFRVVCLLAVLLLFFIYYFGLSESHDYNIYGYVDVDCRALFCFLYLWKWLKFAAAVGIMADLKY